MTSNAMFVSVLAAAVTAGLSQPSRPSEARNEPSIVGVWRADMDGLPYITINITSENGTLSGAVLFYLHRRNEGQPVTSTPGVPEPLFNLSFDGKTLSFQVSHRRAHPPGSLSDPPVTFRMRLTRTDKAEVVNENENSSALTLDRTDY